MTSKAAKDLKKRIVQESAACFEPMTFGELKVYEKFICFPLPGDNSGHGGFRGISRIFTKAHSVGTIEVLTSSTHGRAENLRGVSSIFPNSMLVLRIA
ncbi:MAG: hypothetical protein Q8P76_01100 [bacterium]|nr:hypothetical protein [bacterium]